ncbi:hypothetical protein HA402_014154 [Bradysia odoriphaga]|nr:hypothetical protein HA402_014154 [Bradysia odoriphaga]
MGGYKKIAKRRLGEVYGCSQRVPGYGNVTLKRSAHTNPKIFLEFELTQNLKDYDVEGKVFYSPLGNNRYILLPFKIYRQPICKVLNSEYRNRVMHDIHKFSNFPFSEDKSVDLCGLMPLLFADYALESAIILNKTSRVPGYGNMTLKRSAHMNPKIFLEFELTQNLKDYDVELRMFYSPLGNNRYLLLPFKVYRQPICKVLNSEYRNRAMHDVHNYSNFPFSEDKNVDLCSLMPMGHYYWRNYSADLSLIPRSLTTGRYRVQFLFYKRHARVSCKGAEFQSLFT